MLCFSLVVPAEAASVWSQTYGQGTAYSIVATSDGGYAIAALTARGETHSDALLVKTDSAGNMQWSQIYGDWFIENVYSLIQTADGGYAIAGNTYSQSGIFNEDGWLVKTDAAGQLQWSKTIYGYGSDGFYSLVAAPDGGYVLAGYTTLTSTRDSWLVKTDAFGNVQWNKTYPTAPDDFASAMIATPDGGYALAGSGLFKTDAYGNLEWNQTYGVFNSSDSIYEVPLGTFTSLTATSDGGYAACGLVGDGGKDIFGFESTDFRLVKTDRFGNLQWNRTYGEAGVDFAFSLLHTQDGGYAIAGCLNYTFYMYIGYPQYDVFIGDAWLVKTDALGNMEWNQTYGGEGIDEIRSLLATPDGGYVLAGGKGMASGYSTTTLWLLKTDALGVVPEFPAWATLPSLMIMTLLGAVVLKKRKQT